MKTIWVLEDESALQFVYSEILSPDYQVRFFNSLAELEAAAGTRAESDTCDLLIADLRLSDGNFLDFLSRPRAHQLVKSPFIIVSSLDHQQTLRQCFNEGALDYLTKPFTPSELVVKVERLLQRQQTLTPASVEASSGIELDAAKLRVKVGTLETRLTAKELQIFSILYGPQGSAMGCGVSRSRLQSEVWGEAKVSHKSLDVHLFHLRRKLDKLGLEIECEVSGGFRLKRTEAPSKPQS